VHKCREELAGPSNRESLFQLYTSWNLCRPCHLQRPAAGAAATGPEIIPTAGGPSCLAAHHLRASDLLKGRADARSSWSKLPAATGVRALPRHAVLEELEVALRNFRLD